MTIKVAISQRVLPHYRVPVFAELAQRPGIDLTVFYGKSPETGAARNASHIEDLKHIKLPTIVIDFAYRGIEKYRVFHPTLAKHLVMDSFDVVIVEPATNFFNNLITYPVCKLFRKKLIWWEAGNEKTISPLRRYIDPIIRTMIRASDAYITYNSLSDQYLKALGVHDNRIFRAQNTLDTSQIAKDIANFSDKVPQLKSELGIQEAKVIVYIGAVEHRKRIENLIEAVNMLRNQDIDAVLLIVGDGIYEPQLRRSLSSQAREYIKLVGQHTTDAVLYLLASDVVVLPGQGGLAVNHALVCGRPVIATEESDAIRDYIENGRNGFVVDVNSAEAIAQAAMRIFLDPSLHESLLVGASESGSRLSLSRMVDGIEAAIRYSVSGKSSRSG